MAISVYGHAIYGILVTVKTSWRKVTVVRYDTLTGKPIEQEGRTIDIGLDTSTDTFVLDSPEIITPRSNWSSQPDWSIEIDQRRNRIENWLESRYICTNGVSVFWSGPTYKQFVIGVKRSEVLGCGIARLDKPQFVDILEQKVRAFFPNTTFDTYLVVGAG